MLPQPLSLEIATSLRSSFYSSSSSSSSRHSLTRILERALSLCPNYFVSINQDRKRVFRHRNWKQSVENWLNLVVMDNETLEFLLSKQLRIQSQSRSDPCDEYEYEYEYEENEEEYDEEDDDGKMEFPCPYCSDDFDIVELCYHLESEHYNQIARNGICPICAMRVSMDLIGHLTKQHGKMIKIQVKLKLLKDQDETTVSLLKKEFHDEYMKSVLGNSCSSSLPDMAPDPLLSSFMYSLPANPESSSVQSAHVAESSLEKEKLEDNLSKRECESSPPLSDKDHEERTRRSQFVRGMLCSTFLDGDF
ncbi:unnamed protein product [Rhodiola kirilowii]